jgi:hypothetical protein
MDEDANLRANLAALGPGALAELQQALGGSGEHVREYRELEAGTTFPSSDTWDRICELYGWSQSQVG